MNADDILDATDDGTIQIEADDDGGMTINVDTDTELGERIAWQAGHQGETPAEFVREAVEEAIEREHGGRR